jgi:hypothetical protein
VQRTVTVSPRAIERLAEMRITEDEWPAIREQARTLAASPTTGYPVPFRISSQTMFRFDVGRFGLLYIFSSESLHIVAVVPA